MKQFFLLFALMVASMTTSLNATNTNLSDTVAGEKVWEEMKTISPTWDKVITEAQKNTVNHDKLEQKICQAVKEQTGHGCNDQTKSTNASEAKSSNSQSDNKPQPKSGSECKSTRCLQRDAITGGRGKK